MSKYHTILPLTGTAAEDIFVRQADVYSCGPACLTSVARLYGVTGIDYHSLRDALTPNPEVGSCNFKMAEVSREKLPVIGAGEDSYTGGVAVANIMYQGEGHYVVFLCREGDDVLFYDPYDHVFVQARLDDLEWISESKHLTRWSINFADLPENNMERWRQLAKTPGRENGAPSNNAQPASPTPKNSSCQFISPSSKG